MPPGICTTSQSLKHKLSFTVSPSDPSNISRVLFAAKRDKQEAEGKAAHATRDLQQHRQESEAQVQELQQSARQQLQDAKDHSEDKMENYCNSFRLGPACASDAYVMSKWSTRETTQSVASGFVLQRCILLRDPDD